MHKNRLEAFSDGVIAIIITIMVLELKVPHNGELIALQGLGSVFLCYVLSFIYVAIYWNNHHHLFQLVHHVNGPILWANMHLLFWLSLIPFSTSWMGENNFLPWPVLIYGVNLLMCAIAFNILTRVLLTYHEADSKLVIALGKDFKGKISLVFYVIGLATTFYQTWIAYSCYVLVALIWLIPDPRIEKVI